MKDQLIDLKNIRILSAKGFDANEGTTQSIVQKWL